MRSNRWILEEVLHAEKQGIHVDVDGVSYENRNPQKLLLVLQKGNYMLDYEGDALGNITALHIDPVGPKEKSSYKSLRCTKNRSEKEYYPGDDLTAT